MLQIFLHVVKTPLARALVVVDDGSGAIDYAIAARARLQTQIDVFDAVAIARIKAAQLGKEFAANHQTGTGHHIEIARLAHAWIVGGHPAIHVVGHAVYQFETGVLYRPRVRVEQLGPDDADLAIGIG